MALVPARMLERTLEIKKSRFIARAAPASTREQALSVLDAARAAYPDARHHCWAYLLGTPASASAAMSDDGEPGGTAGKPILNVIQHKGIGDVMVVVSRYFGGIKLGAGGLVRAYAGATEAVLSELPLIERRPVADVTLSVSFAREQAVRHWATQNEAELLSVDYGNAVVMRLSLPETSLEDLHEFCNAEGIDLHRND